jgi:GGDEF domain-containing protein
MSKRLKELGEMNLDANPLTRLPGNLAIEKALLTRLQEKVPFAFCLVDLDNFKAFGDRYGYIRGSEVLKKVAGILTEAVKALGSVPDFLGHIGGDDYVIITDPLRMEKLCEKVIHDFDETIPGFYDEEDRQRGYIISRDRKDVEQQFPFMTVSIAVVTNQKRAITSPMQVAEIAAQLKQYAKTFPRSVYVVDQRRTA